MICWAIHCKCDPDSHDDHAAEQSLNAWLSELFSINAPQQDFKL